MEKIIMRKVFDTFTFYNEFDMLEFRLMELDPVVDKFIIAESTLTFSGNKKPLFFEANKSRFKKYLHKIHYIVVDDSPTGFTREKTWEREYHQRDSISKSFDYLGIRDNDIIFHGDLDEIPNVDLLKKYKKEGVPYNAMKLQMENFYYNIETKLTGIVEHIYVPKIFTYKVFKDELEKGNNLSKIRYADWMWELNAGWHYTYFNTPSEIKNKIHEYSHSYEYDKPEINNIDNIEEAIKNKQDIFKRIQENGEPFTFIKVPHESNPNLPKNYKFWLKKSQK